MQVSSSNAPGFGATYHNDVRVCTAKTSVTAGLVYQAGVHQGATHTASEPTDSNSPLTNMYAIQTNSGLGQTANSPAYAPLAVALDTIASGATGRFMFAGNTLNYGIRVTTATANPVVGDDLVVNSSGGVSPTAVIGSKASAIALEAATQPAPIGVLFDGTHGFGLTTGALA